MVTVQQSPIESIDSSWPRRDLNRGIPRPRPPAGHKQITMYMQSRSHGLGPLTEVRSPLSFLNFPSGTGNSEI